MLSRCIAPVESHFFVQTNFTAPVSTLPTQYGTAQLSVGRRTRTPNVFFSFYLLYYPVSVGAKLTAFYIAIDIRLCFLRSSIFLSLPQLEFRSCSRSFRGCVGKARRLCHAITSLWPIRWPPPSRSSESFNASSYWLR